MHIFEILIDDLDSFVESLNINYWRIIRISGPDSVGKLRISAIKMERE